VNFQDTAKAYIRKDGTLISQNSIFVDHDLKLSKFYADYCRLLKFIEYWEQNGICL
jgi:hypothetical protein